MATKKIAWIEKDLQVTKEVKAMPFEVDDETIIKVGDVFIREWEISDLIALFGDINKVIVFINAFKGTVKYREFEHDIDTYTDDQGKEIPFRTKGIARNFVSFTPTAKGEEIIEEKTKQLLFG